MTNLKKLQRAITSALTAVGVSLSLDKNTSLYQGHRFCFVRPLNLGFYFSTQCPRHTNGFRWHSQESRHGLYYENTHVSMRLYQIESPSQPERVCISLVRSVLVQAKRNYRKKNDKINGHNWTCFLVQAKRNYREKKWQNKIAFQ